MRISTTVLDSFRLFMQPEQEWMSEAQLIASIKGEFVPTRSVQIGKAFGTVLEDPYPYRVDDGYVCDDVKLSDAVMGPALALINRKHTVFEAKSLGIYAGHQVVAKADQLIGADLIETKTTFSSFDFDKYADAYQWRFMLDIFLAARVTYHVFCLSEDERSGVISLRDVQTFHLYPYAAMRADCEALVHEFDRYVTAKGLCELLNERQAAAVGAL